MTTDAGAPAKRANDDCLEAPPCKTLKAEDGGAVVTPAPEAPAQPQPPPAAPTPPTLAALLVPVPPRWDDRALRSWLTNVAGVTRIRVARKKKGATLAWLSFGCVADRVAAQAAVAAAPPPPGMKRGGRPAIKDDHHRTIVPASELDVRDVVAPLHRLPYAKQLALKLGKVAAALGRLEAGEGGPDASAAWAAALTPVGILRSPATRGYRNKCEFSVGPGVEEGSACVGFCLGAFKDGIVEVAPPGPAPHVSPTAAAAADAMTAFLAAGGGGAALPAWDKVRGAGFWRLLTVREARVETPMPVPLGDGPAALLEEGLAGPRTPCPPFVALEWERWLVPAGALPAREGAGGAAPAGAAAGSDGAGATPTPTTPPPPLPPPEEVMLVIQVDPTAAPAAVAAAELACLGKALVAAVEGVAADAGTPPPSTSVWVQHHSGPSNAADEDAPLVCLSGEGSGGEGSCSSEGGTLTDSLAGLRFRVSPSSFFQVNSPAAALLYRVAVAWADPAPGDVILDVCCGTGTLGVCAASVVVAGAVAGAPPSSSDQPGSAPPPPPPRVLGVDIVPAAIEDAVANAAANGLDGTACTFVAGRAEDAMAGLLERAAGGSEASDGTAGSPPPSLIAIVDPPRAGLHPKVCAALRGCAAIRRIVYVSCNVASQVEDARRLCAPSGGGGGGRGGGGGSFRPVRSLAVDLFPHTAHVESVLLLER